MRITFVLPPTDYSGGHRVNAIHAHGLMRRGHDVLVVSVPWPRATVVQKCKSVVRGRGWPRARDSDSYFDALPLRHKVLERYRPIEDRDVPDADVVVGTWWETLEWVAALNPSKGAKVSFIQGYDPVFYEEHSPDLLRRAIATWRLPAHKVTISRWLVELAKTRFHDDVVSHVPNSVDTQQFRTARRGRNSSPTVGLLFSTPRCKGVDVALQAFRRAEEELPGLRMVAFGREEPGGELALPDGAEFTMKPPQDTIREIYAKCDVWLCGSRCEGFHLPPLEAMACRCPVVSTRVGGPMDIIDEGINGHLVDVEDAAGLANRLVRVLTMDQGAWLKMSDAAYQTSQKYTWDDATQLFEGALGTAIERNQRGELLAASADRKDKRRSVA